MSRLALTAAAVLCVTTVSIATAAGAAPDEPDLGSRYRPLPAPARLVDTRAGQSTVDGDFAGIGVRRAGTTSEIDVAGRAGLSDEPGSVVLNVTVTETADLGHATVWPCDEPQPIASNLNHTVGDTVAVAVVSRVAPDGTVCISTFADTHLVVDVAGELPLDAFDPLPNPERLADTREGERTIDGDFAGDGRRAAGSTYTIPIAGRGSIPPEVGTVALNVTATTIDEPGFLTVYPCDSERPLASNVNYEPGRTTPNLVFTRLDPAGAVCVYTLASVDLVIDVAGSFPDNSFVPLPEPRRLLDTRFGETTFDQAFRGAGLQTDGATLQLSVAGRADLPDDASAVVLNVTSTGATQPGFVTAHPQGAARPGSSNVNFASGRTVANLVVAALGPTGDVCLFTKGATHLVVDVAGWLPSTFESTAATSCPGRAAPQGAESYRQAHVRRPALQRAVGHDRVAVYVCSVPADSTRFDGSRQHDATDVDFAALANAEVAPYFAESSAGAYTVEFVANGVFPIGRDDDEDDCIRDAIDRTGDGFTNAFAADSTIVGGGFASPGTIFASDSGPDFTVFDRSARAAGRGGWVGGAVISERPNPGTIVHEIGHTLHWPHSFVGPLDEYDNPVDVMSDGFGTCSTTSFIYQCDPANTIAFNRFAAGWLRNGQVISHPSGTANYVLDRANGSGLQLIVAPAADQPHRVMTIEARPAVGHDDVLEHDGVALHVIDQASSSGGLSGLSTRRVTRQARGPGDSYDHVLDVGETATVHGVTIDVLRRVGDRYEVRIAGGYRPPGAGSLTESVAASNGSCTTMTASQAVDAGCTR